MWDAHIGGIPVCLLGARVARAGPARVRARRRAAGVDLGHAVPAVVAQGGPRDQRRERQPAAGHAGQPVRVRRLAGVDAPLAAGVRRRDRPGGDELPRPDRLRRRLPLPRRRVRGVLQAAQRGYRDRRGGGLVRVGDRRRAGRRGRLRPRGRARTERTRGWSPPRRLAAEAADAAPARRAREVYDAVRSEKLGEVAGGVRPVHSIQRALRWARSTGSSRPGSCAPTSSTRWSGAWPGRSRPDRARPRQAGGASQGGATGRATQVCAGRAPARAACSSSATGAGNRVGGGDGEQELAEPPPPSGEHRALGRPHDQRGPPAPPAAGAGTVTSTERVSRRRPVPSTFNALSFADQTGSPPGGRRAPRARSALLGVGEVVGARTPRCAARPARGRSRRPRPAPTRHTAQPARSVSDTASVEPAPVEVGQRSACGGVADFEAAQRGLVVRQPRHCGEGCLGRPAGDQELVAALGEAHPRCPRGLSGREPPQPRREVGPAAGEPPRRAGQPAVACIGSRARSHEHIFAVLTPG